VALEQEQLKINSLITDYPEKAGSSRIAPRCLMDAAWRGLLRRAVEHHSPYMALVFRMNCSFVAAELASGARETVRFEASICNCELQRAERMQRMV
jgi:hypothetical protein